jgi:hypothetical protein
LPFDKFAIIVYSVIKVPTKRPGGEPGLSVIKVPTKRPGGEPGLLID